MGWKPDAIFVKTPEGAQALANRQSGLAPRLRPVLIMVDGKRSYAELAKLCAGMGDIGELLAQLASQGYIQAPAVSVTSSAEPAAGAPAKAATVSLRDAQRWAVRRLTDLMGPGAESLCLRIEAASTPAEFDAAARKARDVLRDFAGAEASARFTEELQKYQPG